MTPTEPHQSSSQQLQCFKCSDGRQFVDIPRKDLNGEVLEYFTLNWTDWPRIILIGVQFEDTTELARLKLGLVV